MRPRRHRLGAILLAVTVAAVTASGVWAALQTSSDAYLPGPFTDASADRFVKDLAAVGIGVYSTGATSPVHAVKAPISPLRLTADQARAAALGASAHAGVSGATLDALTPPVRLGPRLRVRIGVLIAGWAKQAQTPSAALARRILRRTDWSHYRRIVFPQAILALFASDVAVHAGGKSHALRTTSSNRSAAAGICTAVTGFVDQTIDAVFKAIGHLNIPAPSGTGFFASILRGAAAVGEFVVNTAIDIAHFVVVNGVKVAIGAITAPIAAVAGTVAAISQVATLLLPWTGTVVGKPNPIAKGVSAGEDGVFVLTVTAPGSSLEWPPVITDCAQAFNIPLPTLVPSDADVRWDLGQAPAGLVVRGTDSGSLDKGGSAILQFSTTTESPELAAKGVAKTGAVQAIVSVHRKDLDALGDRISQALLAPLPSIVQSTIGPALLGLLTPLLNSAKAKIAAVRDIQTTGTEAVIYHEPRTESPPSQPTQPPPGSTTPGSGFSVTTGNPAVSFDCKGPAATCSSVETFVRQILGPSRLIARTCSGQIDSAWSGRISTPVAGVPPLPTSFVVPAVGESAAWTDLPPALNHTYGSGSTTSSQSTVTRTGDRTVRLHIHLVLDLLNALQEGLHAVEDVVWTGTIAPTIC